MRRIALALLASTVLAGTASAADLAARKAAAAAAAPVTYGTNWTGFYLGGNVGYGWGTNDWTFDGVGTDNDFDGFVGGGQIGFDYQIGNIVVGIQGDISGANLEGKSTIGGVEFKNEATWLASVTGRVGFTVDRALFYVKGGAAWTDLDSTVSDGIDSAKKSETRDGWTVGGGIEYAFAPNWSTFVEYDYYDFGDKNTIIGDGLVKIDTDVSVVKLGVNYRFGGAADPVVRKY
ncbi:outer membrane protein [Blastochloris viridis]|uniref:Outer membrane protein A n=1 Tax=Blastochloris viridis TaxID=1079 RepID=A0A0H5BCN5_BLAVI|nr:outer membrane protein [Blastochloris viridis]ALK08632.1 outer membrane protein A [Blastochloris viridis]BAR98076.1 outer-membrane immunogenic protein precursor [Blastochloris viridis]CUU41295.1 outer membrane protein A [Blastochloris viridis]